jgi:hypothetical protein
MIRLKEVAEDDRSGERQPGIHRFARRGDGLRLEEEPIDDQARLRIAAECQLHRRGLEHEYRLLVEGREQIPTDSNGQVPRDGPSDDRQRKDDVV